MMILSIKCTLKNLSPFPPDSPHVEVLGNHELVDEYDQQAISVRHLLLSESDSGRFDSVSQSGDGNALVIVITSPVTNQSDALWCY
jgi:hypothetical protein